MAGGPSDDVARHLAFVITRDAADQANIWANEYLSQEGSLVTDPIRPQLWSAEKGPFSFEVPPEQRSMLTEIQMGVLRDLCRKAVKQRIADDPRDLVGLIVGHARIGKNFFDY